jgi:PPP family 3-phenylpropionic acid transporter
VFAALFCAMGAHIPFWPIWLADWGLAAGEVGAVLGAAMALRVGAGVAAPWLADLTGRRRTALALLAALAAGAVMAQAAAETRLTLYALTALTAIGMAGAVPLSDALAVAASRAYGFPYAPVRAAGSAAFLAANLLCGAAVARWGSDAALWWIVVSMATLAVAALRHPGGARPLGPRPRPWEAAALLRDRAFLLAAGAGALAQASHAPLYAYGSLHWRAQGLSEGVIGALWAFGVAVEVALMVWLGERLVRWLRPSGAYALAAAAGVARWSAMALDPNLPWLWVWQASHALSFAAAHLAMIAFIGARVAPGLSASAQGLMGAGVGGAAMAAASFGAAGLYPLAAGGVYWLGAALAAGALACALGLRRASGGAG